MSTFFPTIPSTINATLQKPIGETYIAALSITFRSTYKVALFPTYFTSYNQTNRNPDECPIQQREKENAATYSSSDIEADSIANFTTYIKSYSYLWHHLV